MANNDKNPNQKAPEPAKSAPSGPTVQQLAERADKLKTEYDQVREALDKALVDTPYGAVFKIGGIDYEVRMVKDQKKIVCAYSKRQLALMRGETPPPTTTRNRRTKAEIEAARAEKEAAQ